MLGPQSGVVDKMKGSSQKYIYCRCTDTVVTIKKLANVNFRKVPTVSN